MFTPLWFPSIRPFPSTLNTSTFSLEPCIPILLHPRDLIYQLLSVSGPMGNGNPFPEVNTAGARS
jgi:hypothetical protein